jgi:hypothetical protein
MTSPCIDAGHPDSPVGHEVRPHRDIINMGAYGGSMEASKSFHEDPVYIPHPVLREEIEKELGRMYPTPLDMLNLTEFKRWGDNPDRECKYINDLTGLEYAANLETLIISHFENNWHINSLAGLTQLTHLEFDNSHVLDISPLFRLRKLRHLDFHDIDVSDLSPLSGMVHLETLIIYRNNKIRDFSLLARFTKLKELDMHITLFDREHSSHYVDISPLTLLRSLEKLNILYLPLEQEAYDIHIPQIQANNPNLREFLY